MRCFTGIKITQRRNGRKRPETKRAALEVRGNLVRNDYDYSLAMASPRGSRWGGRSRGRDIMNPSGLSVTGPLGSWVR